jgi:hypothetical protein
VTPNFSLSRIACKQQLLAVSGSRPVAQYCMIRHDAVGKPDQQCFDVVGTKE